MHPHKHNNSGTLLQKIQLLQSNTNRVLNQHDVINKLLADPHIANLFKQHIEDINSTMAAVDRLKHKYNRVVMSKQGGRNRMKMSHTDGRVEIEIRDTYHAINKFKEHMLKLKQQQSYQARQSNQNLLAQTLQIKNNNKIQLQAMRKNVTKYLESVKNETTKNHQERVIEYAHKYMGNQYEPYCQDIQADIGMTICEIQYCNHLKTKQDVQRNAQKIKKEFAVHGQKQSKQLAIGKFQRQLVLKQLLQFNNQTQKRIICDCQLLLKSIQLAIQCIKANIKSKTKRSGLANKYSQEVIEFKKRVNKIGYEINGMRLKIQLTSHKIKILDDKIIALNPNQTRFGSRLEFNSQQIRQNYEKCKISLQQFRKLKGEFQYSQ